MNERSCLTTNELIKSIEKRTKKSKKNFEVKPVIIITFSNFFLDYITQKMGLEQDDWLFPYHPYASNPIFHGKYNDKELCIIIPPMGASPIATVAEDLIYCGAKFILLACGCWGIGPAVNLYDLIIPTHAIGKDGTSIYYNRKTNQERVLNKGIVNLIIEETKNQTDSYHIGKNFSFEAFYKLEKKEILRMQNSGYISIENGELNVLATICSLKNINFGALFYNYYNPLNGWKIPWLNEKKYKACVKLQAEIILKIIQKWSFK